MSILDGEDPGEQPEPSGAGALELGDEPLLDDVQGVPRPRLRRELPSHGQLDDALQVYAPDLRRQRVQRLRGHVIDDDPLAARAQLDDAQHVSDRNLVINEREHLTKQVQYQQVHGEVPDTAVRALDDEQRQAREAPGRPGVRGRPRGESEDDAHEVEYVPRPEGGSGLPAKQQDKLLCSIFPVGQRSPVPPSAAAELTNPLSRVAAVLYAGNLEQGTEVRECRIRHHEICSAQQI